MKNEKFLHFTSRCKLPFCVFTNNQKLGDIDFKNGVLKKRFCES